MELRRYAFLLTFCHHFSILSFRWKRTSQAELESKAYFGHGLVTVKKETARDNSAAIGAAAAAGTAAVATVTRSSRRHNRRENRYKCYSKNMILVLW